MYEDLFLPVHWIRSRKPRHVGRAPFRAKSRGCTVGNGSTPPGHAQILPAAWYRERERERLLGTILHNGGSGVCACACLYVYVEGNLVYRRAYTAHKFVTLMICRLPKTTTRKTRVCPTLATPHCHVTGWATNFGVPHGRATNFCVPQGQKFWKSEKWGAQPHSRREPG